MSSLRRLFVEALKRESFAPLVATALVASTVRAFVGPSF